MRRGFTLIESLTAVTILAFAGSAVLLGVAAALESTDAAIEHSIAAGMAQQLMDEISGKRFAHAGESPVDADLGPEGIEATWGASELFDDIDDYDGLRFQPACDRWGITLGQGNNAGDLRHASLQAGNYFENWRQEVDVYYLGKDDWQTPLAAGESSNYRAVEVRILIDDPINGLRPLARLRRVFAYVPGA